MTGRPPRLAEKAPRPPPPVRERAPARRTSPGRPTASVREAALLILERVERSNARADDLLAEWLPKFPDAHRDRALLTQLVNGTLRRRGWLDWLLAHFVRRGLGSLDVRMRNNLRLALFQLEYMDRIPARAAVFEAVELARKSGHEGLARFTNGVLREAERSRAAVPRPDRAVDPAGAIAVLESHPRWMVERWIAAWGVDDAEAIARAGNRVPTITLRVNRTLSDRGALRRDLETDGLHPETGAYSPDVLHLRENALLPALRAFGEGWFAVQDEASAMVAPLLGARSGDTVLDLCAAPGGKSAHLAELVGADGRVIAVDVNRGALRRVVENRARLRLPNIIAVEAEGRTFELAAPGVDAVLLDAPCSGTGVLARRADARWRRRPEDIERFHALQAALLDHAADLVRPGGAILYATCTLEPEENEGVVDEILARRSDLVLEAITLPAGLDAERPPVVDARGFFRMLPHRHGTDGAFAARLRKRS